MIHIVTGNDFNISLSFLSNPVALYIYIRIVYYACKFRNKILFKLIRSKFLKLHYFLVNTKIGGRPYTYFPTEIKQLGANISPVIKFKHFYLLLL